MADYLIAIGAVAVFFAFLALCDYALEYSHRENEKPR